MDKEQKRSYSLTKKRVREVVSNEDFLSEKLQTIYDLEEMEIPSCAEEKSSRENVLQLFAYDQVSFDTMFSSLSERSIPQPPPSTPKNSAEENEETNTTLRFALKDSVVTSFKDESSKNDEESDSNVIIKKVKYDMNRNSQSKSKEGILDKHQINECSLFGKVENFASIFVNDIISTSVGKIIERKGGFYKIVKPDQDSKKSDSETNIENFVKWPRICDFTVTVGECCLNDYMLSWTFDEAWLYCIDFLLVQSDEYNDYFKYEVKWSIPTIQYPIPQATASIFFTIEVSKFKPKYCLVDVTYVFEGSRFVQSPGQVEFQESFLFDIIFAKLITFQHMRV
ncbi:hypothetical protein RN001_000391 [Aquatica leii]|uniref:Uncharacterized protein n=1 Tax=Aquatica leii TaxID=1421715 RepID=A0AAN7Q9L6_9COLE|nr:hypothetical protein RN001_000391 [Aquatica leii]